VCSPDLHLLGRVITFLQFHLQIPCQIALCGDLFERHRLVTHPSI
jgi:hypothetical protein